MEKINQSKSNNLLKNYRFNELLEYLGSDPNIDYDSPWVYYDKATAFIGISDNDSAFNVIIRLKLKFENEKNNANEFILSFGLNNHRIGSFELSRNEIIDELEDFIQIYNQSMSLTSNHHGGMPISDRFYIWCILRKIKPNLVIESGVWRGIGTFIIEKALPNAEIICLDIDFSFRHYISSSPKVHYIRKDFFHVDWTKYDINNSLIIIDDHQDAVRRIQEANFLGFKRMIFQDNYADIITAGDALSLKQALSCHNFNIYKKVLFNEDKSQEYSAQKYINHMIQRYITNECTPAIRMSLKRIIKNYYECPPLLPLPFYSDYYASEYSKIGHISKSIFNDYEKNNHKNLELFKNSVYNFMCFVELI